MVEILKPQEGQSIYDPACGSGGILVTAAQYIKKRGQDAQKVFLFGQESVYATFILAKMNMILHGFNDAKVEREDTFMEPKHLVNGGLMKFDNVMENPPWNLDEGEWFRYNYFKRGLHYYKQSRDRRRR